MRREALRFLLKITMAITRIDSRHLRYFVAVAEELNFRRAADRLHLAQPALTRQITWLESAMRAQLLIRDKRHVALTPAGRVALEASKKILSELDDLIAKAQHAAQGLTGTLRVGFISYMAYGYLPMILRAFRAEHPNVEIELCELRVTQQLETLIEDRIDVAIMRPLHEDSRVTTKVIARSSYVVALPTGHPLVASQSVQMKDLVAEEIITPPRAPGNSFHGRILRFCADAGFVPALVREASDSQAMLSLVSAGMGVSIVPDAMTNLHTAGVHYRPIKGLNETADIALAWAKDNKSELLKSFVRVATQATALSGSSLIPLADSVSSK